MNIQILAPLTFWNTHLFSPFYSFCLLDCRQLIYFLYNLTSEAKSSILTQTSVVNILAFFKGISFQLCTISGE